MLKVKNFINGKFEETSKYMDSYDPSNGKVWAEIPDSGANEVNKAVLAAEKAFESWSETLTSKRCQYLMKAADLLESRVEEFIEFESRDQGKPRWLARKVDLPRAILNLRTFASSIQHQMERSRYSDELGVINYTSRTPVGVAALIIPWNLPLYLLTFKLAPALAAGNTVVVKPSEMTSVTAWMFCQLLVEAGLPAGVVNMVFGSGPGAGEPLVQHPSVRLISFTGSTAVGHRIRTITATSGKKLSLELGGKNAGIVFSDVDLKACVKHIIRSSFINQGEVCLCTSRLFVQKPIFDEFIRCFVNSTRSLIVGNPEREDSFLGALISSAHLRKVTDYCRLAKDEGATIHCGFNVDDLKVGENIKEGYYMRPTIISGVDDSSKLMQEEIFGPVVCVVPFDNEEEVVKRVNAVTYGLCASLWTNDSSRTHRLSRQFQVGTVWVNTWLSRDLNMPFGGIKNSGSGYEGTKESYEFYTNLKNICIKI